MTENLVPRVGTECTKEDLYSALQTDWSAVSQTPPTRASILTLMAQSAFETGWWRACWNWNLGNVKHFAGDGHDYYQVRCNEIVGGKVVWFDPPHPATSFRSYPTLVDGAREYLMILRGHFGLAWPAVEAGDVAQFAHLLKQARYYTDDESHYTNSLVQCYHLLDLAILPEVVPEPLKPSAGALHDDELLAELDPPDFDP